MAPSGIEWPPWSRRGPNRGGAATSRLHDERVAAYLGIALAVTFTTCFATGLFSHWGQSEDPWIAYPARPAGLYRVTQGLHVISGVMSVPVLMAKLWVVLPRLFEPPPLRSAARIVERLALFPLVAGGVFMLVTGVANIAAWYPWDFSFTAVHHSVSWITMGALVVHVGAKWVVTRDALHRAGYGDGEGDGGVGSLTRRGFLGTVGATSVTLGVAIGAQTVPAFEPFGLLSPRDLDHPDSPQGFPVNSSAVRRGVVDAARSPGYRLRVTGAARGVVLDLDGLRALPQRDAELPIACVEGWSKSARWTGVPLGELLERAGAPPGSDCRIVSLQRRGLYRTSHLDREVAADPDTLLALRIDGEELHIDHGFPVRLIAPNRPGVWQTKWVTEVRVL